MDYYGLLNQIEDYSISNEDFDVSSTNITSNDIPDYNPESIQMNNILPLVGEAVQGIESQIQSGTETQNVNTIKKPDSKIMIDPIIPDTGHVRSQPNFKPHEIRKRSQENTVMRENELNQYYRNADIYSSDSNSVSSQEANSKSAIVDYSIADPLKNTRKEIFSLPSNRLGFI